MGKRGPPKKPTAKKKLEGTYRKDRAPKREVQPPSEIPPCPDYLDHHARECWDYFATQLLEAGLLTALDRAAFVTFCQAYAEIRDCEEVIAVKGRTFETQSGYVQQRPEISIRNQALALYVKLFTHFGLSPSTRAGLDVPAPAREDQDETFLFRGSGPKLVKDEPKKKRGKKSA